MGSADAPPLPLACTVRDCGQPLHRTDANYRCPRGHTFDVARRGYVNLLQPQDRRSRHAGDTAAAVAARSRLLAAGVGAAAMTAIARAISSLDIGPRATVVDLGCGSGELLGEITGSAVTLDGPQRHGDTERFLSQGAPPITAVGIDLSTAAVEAAARRFPALTWLVANADRRLPLLDTSVDVIVSLNGRRNPIETARVLRAGGALIVGLPAADDLIELREQVLGGRLSRDRADGVIDEHAALFTTHDRVTVRERRTLDRTALLDLLEGTYRGRRTSHADRLAALDTLDVTSATDVMVFRRR